MIWAARSSSWWRGLVERVGIWSIAVLGTTSSAKRMVDRARAPSMGADGGQVLLAPHDHRADGDPLGIVHGVAQEGVGGLGLVGGGGQPVGAVVEDGVDLREVDEVGDVDGAGRLRPQLLD